MIENKISATLPQEDTDSILGAIKLIKEKLPFLINLTVDESRALNYAKASGKAAALQATLDELGKRFAKKPGVATAAKVAAARKAEQ
ncbi:MAG: hypothetical protein ACKVZH_28320 [Blastocatellia bacterium]